MQLATTAFEKTHWTEFIKILEKLGKDGMSSDKSTDEEDTHHPCYHVSLLPWKRDFNVVMEAIDVERLGEQSGYSKRGSVPTKHFRQKHTLAHSEGGGASSATIHISHHPPVTKLPAVFYNKEWISMRSEEYIDGVLCPLEQAYEWVIRIAEAYSGQESTCG